MRDVGAELAGLCDANERVHVRTVHVDLATRVMDERTDLADGLLIDTVRRRVRDHQRGEVVAMLDQLGPQIIKIDVTAIVAGNHDDTHARHHGAGGIRAVGRDGDQADIAMLITTTLVIATDCEEASELALRASGWLQRDGVVPRDRDEPTLQLVDQEQVPIGLIERCKRMDRRKLWPRDGLHLRRRVELHRARAKWDHRAVERDVLAREAAQVAQHLRLGAVLMEDRVRQDLVGAQQVGRECVGRLRIECLDISRDAKGLPERLDVVSLGHLITGNPNRVAVDPPEVDPKLTCLCNHDVGVMRNAHLHRVKEGVVQYVEATATQPLRKDRGQAMDAFGDRSEPLRAVVDGIHAGDYGEQHLRCADI